MSRRRVVIADDDGPLRSLLRATLELDGRFEVVGEADDGMVALELVASEAPDLVLLDLSMPGMDGLEVLDALTRGVRGDRPIVVVLTGFEYPELGERVREAGADAYLTKGTDLKGLADRLAAL